MLIKKINKLIHLINQSKTLNKKYIYILKTPDLINILKIFQNERCINYYTIEKKNNNKFYFKIYLNTSANFEIFSLISNVQQYFFKHKFLKLFLNSNIKLKLYLNTKNGIVRDYEVIKQNIGGVLLFGIKYL